MGLAFIFRTKGIYKAIGHCIQDSEDTARSPKSPQTLLLLLVIELADRTPKDETIDSNGAIIRVNFDNSPDYNWESRWRDPPDHWRDA